MNIDSEYMYIDIAVKLHNGIAFSMLLLYEYILDIFISLYRMLAIFTCMTGPQ